MPHNAPLPHLAIRSQAAGPAPFPEPKKKKKKKGNGGQFLSLGLYVVYNNSHYARAF